MQTLEKQSPQKSVRLPRQALVLVDFLEKQRGYFTYENGPLEEGIKRAAGIAARACAAGMPVFIVTGYFSRTVFPEISEAAGHDAISVWKKGTSAFTSPDFQTMINAYDIDTLIIGGWIRHICVMATVGDALERGYAVQTTDHILFGNRETLNLQARRMSLDFFRRNCLLYDSSEELAARMP